MRSILLSLVTFISFYTSAQPAVQPVLDLLLLDFTSTRDFTLSAYQDEAYFTAQSTLGEVSVIFSTPNCLLFRPAYGPGTLPLP